MSGVAASRYRRGMAATPDEPRLAGPEINRGALLAKQYQMARGSAGASTSPAMAACWPSSASRGIAVCGIRHHQHNWRKLAHSPRCVKNARMAPSDISSYMGYEKSKGGEIKPPAAFCSSARRAACAHALRCVSSRRPMAISRPLIPFVTCYYRPSRVVRNAIMIKMETYARHLCGSRCWRHTARC